MLTRTPGRIATGAIATLAGIAVLSPMAHADSHPSTAPKKPSKLTAQSYTKYLKKQGTAHARTTLVKFSKLNKKQKAVFLKDLQDRKVYKALQGKVNARFNKPVTTTDKYNKEVTFVTRTNTSIAKDKAGTATVRFTVTEKIFNIPVTAETLSIKFGTAPKASKRATATAGVKNVNAAIAIDNKRVNVKGSYAQTIWTATPQVKSFGKKAVYKTEKIFANKSRVRAGLANSG
ncbi:hypothetical protein AB0D83_35835 [Streptomyces decoyicus]|uniref:hypothetical protein n=1 Tax=Streptomyces decoyicus TaxID=249567 RepID=UPI00340A5000